MIEFLVAEKELVPIRLKPVLKNCKHLSDIKTLSKKNWH